MFSYLNITRLCTYMRSIWSWRRNKIASGQLRMHFLLYWLYSPGFLDNIFISFTLDNIYNDITERRYDGSIVMKWGYEWEVRRKYIQRTYTFMFLYFYCNRFYISYVYVLFRNNTYI